MAVEITNLIAAICAVDTTPPQNNPASLPKYKGKGLSEIANAGFAPFAPTPAPPNNSERLAAGIYRMHLTQPLTFTGGEATPAASLNNPGIAAATIASISALGIDAGSVSGDTGCDVIVLTTGGPSVESPLTDNDFTLVVYDLPVQSTSS